MSALDTFDDSFFEDNFFSEDALYRPPQENAGGLPVRVIKETDFPEMVKGGNSVKFTADFGKITVRKKNHPHTRPVAGGVYTVAREEWRVSADIVDSKTCWVCSCYRHVRTVRG